MEEQDLSRAAVIAAIRASLKARSPLRWSVTGVILARDACTFCGNALGEDGVVSPRARRISEHQVWCGDCETDQPGPTQGPGFPG